MKLEAIFALLTNKRKFNIIDNGDNEGRSWDLNPGKRLHRPLGYQATSPRPLSWTFS